MQRTIKSDLATAGDFLRDLGSATANVPGEMRQWWKDGHTRTEWLRAFEDEPGRVGTEQSEADYRLWRYLGMLSDAILVLILVLIVLMVFA